MFGELLAVVLVAFTLTSGQHWHDDAPRDARLLQRHKRFFPLFSVVRFSNSQCTASNNFNGTCFTKRECHSLGGTPLGTCANGFGVCCVVQKTCGTSTNLNNTYFTNPFFPSTYDGGDRCVMTVQRCNSDICQLRIDFLDFSLAQPTSEGVCDYDLLSISGGASQAPRICGENSDQHMYVDFNGPTPITISIDTSSEYSMKRRWNFRVQQIACDSAMRAPSGCLQYYTKVSGTVKSFNYETTTNQRLSNTGVIGTREMANLNYGVCIRKAADYCSIRWSTSEDGSFSISGDGTALTAAAGVTCTTDFVIIPNASEVDTTITASRYVDRYCGSAFTPKMTSLKPFVLYVVTDNTETTSMVPDTQNKGFSLSYKQIICSPMT